MTYEELLEKARETYENEDTPHVVKAWLLANIICPTNTSIEDDVKCRTQVFEYARSLDTCNQYSRANIDRLIAWLEKLGKNKMLNADEVIDWLDYNICNAYDYDGNDISSTLKSKFKEDFKL